MMDDEDSIQTTTDTQSWEWVSTHTTQFPISSPINHQSLHIHPTLLLQDTADVPVMDENSAMAPIPPRYRQGPTPAASNNAVDVAFMVALFMEVGRVAADQMTEREMDLLPRSASITRSAIRRDWTSLNCEEINQMRDFIEDQIRQEWIQRNESSGRDLPINFGWTFARITRGSLQCRLVMAAGWFCYNCCKASLSPTSTPSIIEVMGLNEAAYEFIGEHESQGCSLSQALREYFRATEYRKGKCSYCGKNVPRQLRLLCTTCPARLVLGSDWWRSDFTSPSPFDGMEFEYHSVTGEWRDVRYAWQCCVGVGRMTGRYQLAWKMSEWMVWVYGEKDDGSVEMIGLDDFQRRIDSIEMMVYTRVEDEPITVTFR